MTECEVFYCTDDSTGTVSVKAHSDETTVTWNVCGRHLAAVGFVLLSTEKPHDEEHAGR